MLATTDASQGWGCERAFPSSWGSGHNLLWVVADSIARHSDVSWCSVLGPVYSIRYRLDAGCEVWAHAEYDDYARLKHAKDLRPITLMVPPQGRSFRGVYPLPIAWPCAAKKHNIGKGKGTTIVKQDILPIGKHALCRKC